MKQIGRIALVFILAFAVVGCGRESGEPGTGLDGDSRKTQIEDGGAASEKTATPVNTAFGVSLTVKNVSKTGADLYFSRYSGDPEHTIYYGEDYKLQVFDEPGQAWKDVDFDAPPVFVDIAYRMPYGDIVDFHVDWEAGCGSLAPGLYSISKTLIDDNYDPSSDGSGRAEVGVCFIIY